MTVVDDTPLIGATARTLGARVPEDISVDSMGMVRPKSGGMSIARTWRELPIHRIPSRLRPMGVPDARGKNNDPCWRMGSGGFTDGRLAGRLHVTLDSPWHGVVEPDGVMPHAQYVEEINNTKALWVIDET